MPAGCPRSALQANVLRPIRTSAGVSMTVLVVDDDGGTRSVLHRLLVRDFAVRVIEAQDGLEAVQLLLGGRVDLVILDLGMRGMGGIETLEAIRRIPRPRRPARRRGVWAGGSASRIADQSTGHCRVHRQTVHPRISAGTADAAGPEHQEEPWPAGRPLRAGPHADTPGTRRRSVSGVSRAPPRPARRGLPCQGRSRRTDGDETLPRAALCSGVFQPVR